MARANCMKGQVYDVRHASGKWVKAICVRVPKRRDGKYGFIPYTPDPSLGEKIFYANV